MNRFDVLAYAEENGADAAAGLLMMVGPDGFVGDYEEMENELAQAMGGQE